MTLHYGPAQENPESPAQKRPRPSASASVLAEAPHSISTSYQGAVNATAQASHQLPPPGISLKVAANIVVQCLTPFYKEGKFASKVGEVSLGLGHLGALGRREREPQGGCRLALRSAAPSLGVP